MVQQTKTLEDLARETVANYRKDLLVNGSVTLAAGVYTGVVRAFTANGMVDWSDERNLLLYGTLFLCGIGLTAVGAVTTGFVIAKQYAARRYLQNVDAKRALPGDNA